MVAIKYSNYFVQKHLDLEFGGVAYTPAGTKYLALFNVAPDFGTGSGGTEVSGTSYARLSVTSNTTNFPNTSTRTKTSGAQFTFATPGSGGWGNIVAFGWFDASTSGNLIGGNFLSGGATVASCSTTNGSATVTTSGSFTGNVVAGCEVTGTGIPAGTTVSSVNSSTSITLSQNATATGTVSLTFSGFQTVNAGNTVYFSNGGITFSIT